jgi:hypothetical protein
MWIRFPAKERNQRVKNTRRSTRPQARKPKVHHLVAVDLAVGSPEFGTPALKQVHRLKTAGVHHLVAEDLEVGRPEIGTPTHEPPAKTRSGGPPVRAFRLKRALGILCNLAEGGRVSIGEAGNEKHDRALRKKIEAQYGENRRNTFNRAIRFYRDGWRANSAGVSYHVDDDPLSR